MEDPKESGQLISVMSSAQSSASNFQWRSHLFLGLKPAIKPHYCLENGFRQSVLTTYCSETPQHTMINISPSLLDCFWQDYGMFLFIGISSKRRNDKYLDLAEYKIPINFITISWNCHRDLLPWHEHLSFYCTPLSYSAIYSSLFYLFIFLVAQMKNCPPWKSLVID